MTLLGKVFTFIVLIFSVVFFFLSVIVNARHMNYRDLVENKSSGLKVQLQKEQAKTKEQADLIQRQQDDMATEQLGRRITISALETALAQKDAELKAKEALLSAEQAKNSLLIATEAASKQELAARTAENEEMRKMLIQSREDRDNQFKKFTQTYDQLVRTQGAMQTLKQQSDEVSREFTAAKQQLDILGIGTKTQLDGPPAVNGIVTAVLNNSVEVSIGLDDGIRIGDQLDVYRGGAYLGKLRVTRSIADKAVAEIMPEHAKGFIVVGDRVDSKMNELYVKRPQR